MGKMINYLPLEEAVEVATTHMERTNHHHSNFVEGEKNLVGLAFVIPNQRELHTTPVFELEYFFFMNELKDFALQKSREYGWPLARVVVYHPNVHRRIALSDLSPMFDSFWEEYAFFNGE